MTSTLDYDLTDDAPDGAIARIDYRYGDKLVGQAYLEATVTQGYVPGAVKQSTDTAETETVAETVPSKAPDKKTEPSSKKTGSNKTSWTSSPAFGIVKKVLIAAAVIGAIGGRRLRNHDLSGKLSPERAFSPSSAARKTFKGMGIFFHRI